MSKRMWSLEWAKDLYKAGNDYREITKILNEHYGIETVNNTIATAFTKISRLERNGMDKEHNKNMYDKKGVEFVEEFKEGQDERKPRYIEKSNYFIINSKTNSVSISKTKLRKLKEMYCLSKMTINQVCLELEISRNDFNLIKTAFGITKDDVPVLDEDLEDIEEAVTKTLQKKKQLYFTKLQVNELTNAAKLLEKYEKKEYWLNRVSEKVDASFKDWTPPKVNVLKKVDNGRMYELPIYDVHFGKMAWKPETGENFDYKIAKQRFMFVIEDVLQKLKGEKFEKVLFPIGQDFFNYDTIDGKTTLGTSQDNDLRWQKLYNEGIKLLVTATTELQKLGKVECFYSPGNHDTMTSYYATSYVDAWFRNNENVHIDLSPNVRHYVEFGKTLLGFTHTNKERTRIFGDMQSEMPEAWGRTLFREWHGGHLHSNHVKEMYGVTVRNLSCITGKDAWHHQFGYSGAIARVQSFIYDKERGPENILITNVMR